MTPLPPPPGPSPTTPEELLLLFSGPAPVLEPLDLIDLLTGMVPVMEDIMDRKYSNRKKSTNPDLRLGRPIWDCAESKCGGPLAAGLAAAVLPQRTTPVSPERSPPEASL